MKKLTTLLALTFCLLLGTVLSAQKAPKISVTPERVLHHNHVELKGTGFTPKSNVRSHLRRPDGTEFRVLEMFTNGKGEIEHDIDTVVLMPGVHEMWVEDMTAKVTSNVVRFEVTMYSKDLQK
jgi:hypothetical protein